MPVVAFLISSRTCHKLDSICCSLQPIEPSCVMDPQPSTTLQPPTVTTMESTSSTTLTTMEPLVLAAIEPQPLTVIQPSSVTPVEPTFSTTLTTLEPPGLAEIGPLSSTAMQPPTVTPMEPASSNDNQKSSISFHDLQMLPCRSRPSNKRIRAKPPSFLLTSDEHFSFLESKTKNLSKIKKDAASKIFVDENQSGKCRKAEQCRKRKTTNQKGNKMQRQLSQLQFPAVSEKASTDTGDADNTPCNYCEIPYSQSNVTWYKCHACEKWACGNCAHVGRKSKKVFICDECK